MRHALKHFTGQPRLPFRVLLLSRFQPACLRKPKLKTGTLLSRAILSSKRWRLHHVPFAVACVYVIPDYTHTGNACCEPGIVFRESLLRGLKRSNLTWTFCCLSHGCLSSTNQELFGRFSSRQKLATLTERGFRLVLGLLARLFSKNAEKLVATYRPNFSPQTRSFAFLLIGSSRTHPQRVKLYGLVEQPVLQTQNLRPSVAFVDHLVQQLRV